MIAIRRNAALANYENLAVAWHDGQLHNPATRHRRKIIIDLLKKIRFKTVLEVGCGQPYLLTEIKKHFNCDCTGADISQSLFLANRKEFPRFKFKILDIVNKKLNKKYDLIIASEVLEHVSDYQKALNNIAKMAKHYILITVPSSKILPVDRSIGHLHHFQPQEIIKPLKKLGFETEVCLMWGFPFHNLYKYAINLFPTEKIRSTFAESEYDKKKIFVSNIIYYLFFLNLKIWGFQLIILAKRIK